MAIPSKYALITGATSGIGYELAKLFAKDGYSIVIVARYQHELDTTSQALQTLGAPKIITLASDLFDPKAAFDVYKEVKANGIDIDILVNDAGQGLYGEFIETNIQRELDIIQLNIASLVVLTKQFLIDMVYRGKGRILNLASIAGKLPGPLQSVYHGTKAFVHSFTEAIREEVKDKGVTITSLLPGATDTDFFNKAEMTDSKIVQEGELADAEKVAKDGYEALMAGKDMVISGFKNKVQVAISNITPDNKVAAQMHKQQEPAQQTGL
ncbi:SDR family NAD(P)-dependent oxidoreductase [Deminuibacter soli]|uniref:SDR family NAD(P)-dependent oxidoreductase n=1 Tax=Deminuibacter soli TaxID=2291815 RepID=A0A3E1NG66_9BACT|nr:SDR family oxidoreductase [Deminuibacter soli]RFM26877.1 SDR family NAD(P)-dependent oxidoreductase [Deminuibacter soli]